MTISLNPLFSNVGRKGTPIPDEGMVADPSANPFAQLLAAQMQTPATQITLETGIRLIDGQMEGAQASEAAMSGFASLSDGKMSLSAGTPGKIVMPESAMLQTMAAVQSPATDSKSQQLFAQQVVASVDLASLPSVQSGLTTLADPLPDSGVVAPFAAAGLMTAAGMLPVRERSGLQVREVARADQDTVLSKSSVDDLLSADMAMGKGGIDFVKGKAAVADLMKGMPSLNDKGFAVRIEAEVAAASIDRSVGVALTPTMQSATYSMPTVAAGAADVQITLPMNKESAWGEALGKQMIATAASGLDNAKIQVSPEYLGPLEITISMNRDQAQIMVVAANPQAKDIVEHHLPALSRMMEQAGLQLADAQVSSQQQHQQQQQQSQGRSLSDDRAGGFEAMSAEAEDALVETNMAGGLKILA